MRYGQPIWILVSESESVRRQERDFRRRAFADAARGIVLRAVAGAEPAVIFALVGERDAAEMGADADHHQPLLVAVLDALLRRLPDRAGCRH